ncbi:MAG: fatty acid desaturase CarF family protein [Polyangiales bacterium]
MNSSTPLAELRPPRAFRVFEVASVVAAFALSISLGASVVRGLGRVDLGLGAGLAITLAAYFACDLVSGVVHFLGDSFGSVDTPWLGRTFVLPFRSHHALPSKICGHDFVETNGNNAFATLFALVPTTVALDPAASPRALGLGLFVCVFSVSVIFTNQIHKWAHVAQPPRVVRWLQTVGVFLSPARHRAHHRAPHRQGYCVTSGLCNALLDPIDFFPRLERLIRALLRLEARPG